MLHAFTCPLPSWCGIRRCGVLLQRLRARRSRLEATKLLGKVKSEVFWRGWHEMRMAFGIGWKLDLLNGVKWLKSTQRLVEWAVQLTMFFSCQEVVFGFPSFFSAPIRCSTKSPYMILYPLKSRILALGPFGTCKWSGGRPRYGKEVVDVGMDGHGWADLISRLILWETFAQAPRQSFEVVGCDGWVKGGGTWISMLLGVPPSCLEKPAHIYIYKRYWWSRHPRRLVVGRTPEVADLALKSLKVTRPWPERDAAVPWMQCWQSVRTDDAWCGCMYATRRAYHIDGDKLMNQVPLEDNLPLWSRVFPLRC